ncbi:MAG TPA: hypothetical protein VGF92_15710 [Stellaceae bacterium]|jgi:hypothetical protein
MADIITSQLSPSQTRVIDPILSNIALGYKNAQLIGETLFPRVPVLVSGGQVLQFGKEAFKQYATRRAWGSDTGRISFGYQGAKYALVEDSIEIPLPRELIRDAQQVPGIDVASIAINMGMDVISLQLERDQAALAVNAANYDGSHKITLSGTSQFSNAACDPDPIIDTAREAVRTSIGRYPNVMVLSAVAFKALRRNATLKAHFQYTTAASITEQMIAQYYSFDKVVAAPAVTSDDAGNFSDIWGNNAIIAYVPQQNVSMINPSYGYTYTMAGHPMVETPYWDPKAKSWVYGTTMERAPQLTGITAGYLLQNPN